jgi:hypothetical protein
MCVCVCVNCPIFPVPASVTLSHGAAKLLRTDPPAASAVTVRASADMRAPLPRTQVVSTTNVPLPTTFDEPGIQAALGIART